MAEVIYIFLHSALGQCVTIAEIIDFNVFDVIAVLLVRLARYSLAGVCRRRPDDGRSGRLAGC